MKCPGQDMKYWKASAIFDAQCPKCNAIVEFYKDDTSRRCGNCGHRFVNPKMDFGCASYCPYAEQCLGALPEEFTGARDNLLKDKVAVEMKRFFQTDFKRIRQATAAAKLAENIGKVEGGNLAILLCAAYLHGTGPIAAQAILTKVGAGEQMIEEICELLSQNPTVQESDSLQAKIMHDVLTLLHFQEELKESLKTTTIVPQTDEMKLFTNSAKSLATSLTE
ncbi:MAG: phosphohydrolase [Proteobacteria bacterium]|nr:phosphohydrolase [Pseudomonadota bacterium]